MRILHVISSLNPAGGGVVEGLTQSAMQMQKLGHTIEVISLDDPKAPWLKNFPLMHFPLGPSVFRSRLLHYYYSPKLKPWLHIHAHQYDAIIINGIWQYHSFGTWQVLRKMNVPYFVFTHGMLDPWFRRAYPIKHAVKWLYWIWADYRVLRDAKFVLFTCEEERIQARQSFSLYRCREKVVGYGTSVSEGDPIQKKKLFLEMFPQLLNKKIILFVGRIHPKKGCDLLIEAFSKVAKRNSALHLVMVGPDQAGWQKDLVKQSQKLDIANQITWTGMLISDLKWGAYYAAEVFILPSHQENFGIVVVEAMMCGIPVLITKKVNIWHEIEKSAAGLAAEDSVEGIEALLEKWLTMTEYQKTSMKKNAVNCFYKYFEMNAAVEKLIESLR